MQQTHIGHKIIHLERIDSTNNYTAKLFKSGEITAGTVIMADIQTDGRGQRANSWESEAFENITLSFPLDLKSMGITNPLHLNYIIPLAIIQFLQPYVKDICIKWPNDILVDKNKIAGILIENQLEGQHVKSCIVGIGININQKSFASPNATSLFCETSVNFQPRLLVFELIRTLNETFSNYFTSGANTLKTAFENALWLMHQSSSFELITTGEKITGTIQGINETGDLIIQTKTALLAFKNGEIKFLARG